MTKYGRLIEYTYASGATELLRTKRPTAALASDWRDMQAKGWVLASFLDQPAGAQWVHGGQVRHIDNQPC